MAEELSQEEVFDNDKDPADAIAAIRREEAKESGEEIKETESEEIVLLGDRENSEAQKLEDTTISEDENQESEDDRKIRLEAETDKQHGKVDTDTDTDDNSSETSEEKENTDDDKEKDDDSTKEEGEAAEIKTHSFKADGKDFNFTEDEMIEQFEGVFGKAMNYTQKMQKMAPFRKMISALEEQGVTQDQLNTALDAIGGDKNAIRKLAQNNSIDLSDLSFEEEDKTPYTPKEYGKNDLQIQVEEIETDIGKDPEYQTTVDIIDNQWDDGSRKLIADNPEMIRGLHADIKNGVYDKVAPEAAKLQMLDGNLKSNLDYYLLAGQKLKAKAEAEENAKTSQDEVDKLNSKTQEAEDKFSKGSSEAEDKRAAASTGSSSGERGVIDYLDDDNDEKFNEWYKKLEANS